MKTKIPRPKPRDLINYVYLILSFRTHMVNFMCIHQLSFPYIVLNFTFCLYYKLLYSTIFLVYNNLSCSGSLANQEVFSGFQGASARACGSVGTCQSLTGAFFGIGANFHSCEVWRG